MSSISWVASLSALTACLLVSACEPDDTTVVATRIVPPPAGCKGCAASVDPVVFDRCQGTCDGCCTPSGECESGTSGASCGAHGDLCLQCESDVCHQGACGTVGPCRESCSGCCTPTGECHGGHVASICGASGDLCQSCAGSCAHGACCPGPGAACLTTAECCAGSECLSGHCL